MPLCASAAATSSCVESGFEPHTATFAPPALSVSMRTAVSFVTWRHAPIVTPFKGFVCSNSLRISARTGMCAAAQSMRWRPSVASAGFLIAWGGGVGLIGTPNPALRYVDEPIPGWGPMEAVLEVEHVGCYTSDLTRRLGVSIT